MRITARLLQAATLVRKLAAFRVQRLAGRSFCMLPRHSLAVNYCWPSGSAFGQFCRAKWAVAMEVKFIKFRFWQITYGILGGQAISPNAAPIYRNCQFRAGNDQLPFSKKPTEPWLATPRLCVTMGVEPFWSPLSQASRGKVGKLK